jgi:hypothetical protein
MAFNVTFNFTDEFNRKTQRTWHNTQALIATVLTDLTTIAALIDVVSLAGLDGVVISQVSDAENSAAEAGSNVDANLSVQVEGADGYRYDFNLPCPDPGVLNADGTLDTADAGIVALFGAFAGGDSWRINLRNPTAIASVIGGELDK